MNIGVEQALRVQMLGEFKIYFGNEEISLGKISVSKTIELFQLLMLHIKDGIPKKEIMETLYKWEAVENENRSMNNLIYRLKQQLKDVGIEQEEYISIDDGICRWVCELPLEVDLYVFKERLSQASQLEGEEKLNVLRSAFALYKEELLSNVHGKVWLLEEREQLKELYISCIKQLTELLKEREEYEELLRVYLKAAEIYPFDGWESGLIDCLQRKGQYKEAYELYQNTIQHYTDGLGVTLSDDALSNLSEMAVKIRREHGCIEDIQDTISERQEKSGAFYCAYPSFIDVYRYTSRIMERSGESAFFMMCSVIYFDYAGRKSPNAGDILCDAIGKALRKGDIYSRYSKDQFVIILRGAQFENCAMIFERIRKHFKKMNRNTNCDIEYNVTELKDFDDNADSMSFRSNNDVWN